MAKLASTTPRHFHGPLPPNRPTSVPPTEDQRCSKLPPLPCLLKLCFRGSTLLNTLLGKTHIGWCYRPSRVQGQLRWSVQLQSDSCPKEREREQYTHQSDRGTSSYLVANSLSDGRHLPIKTSQGTTQGNCPAVWCYYISDKYLV